MTAPHPPGTVVAKLRLPIPADGLSKIIRTLERAYGPGLVFRTDAAVFEDGWFIIATSSPPPPS